jgi:N-glycosidase YbiA
MVSEFQGEFRFLSNFWEIPIKYEGIWFVSVEHAYQAAKTLDMEQRQLIARLNTPGQAKRAGNNLVLRPDWEEVKIPIMRELLKQKFSNRALMYKLRQTKGELIEGNNWGDTFWGVCKGQGENHLGRLLMEIRDS